MREFLLEILTPERRFFAGKVESAVFRTADGGVEILAGHAPVALPVRSAPLGLRDSGGTRWLALTEGFALVGPDRVQVYVDTAEWPGEIDAGRAARALARAEARLPTDSFEWERSRTRDAAARARSRLDAMARAGLEAPQAESSVR